MNRLIFAGLVATFLIVGLQKADAAETASRKPASVKSTIWETVETPVGKACPYQARRYDEIAYQVNGDGGYVCYTCDYNDQTPMLVVTEQTKCSTTIKCRNGKCQ